MALAAAWLFSAVQLVSVGWISLMFSLVVAGQRKISHEEIFSGYFARPGPAVQAISLRENFI